MKSLSILINFLIIATTALAQPTAPDTLWTRTYLETHQVRGQNVQETRDGGYIICGYADTYNSDFDIYLLKTDASGNEQWTRTFGGANFDYGAIARQTDDGGYIITGATGTYGAGLDDTYLIKTDEYGNEVWSRTYGGTGYDGGDDMLILPDGNFIISGYMDCYLPDHGDAYIMKTDQDGNEIWLQTYPYATAVLGLDLTDDGGFIFTGAADLVSMDIVLTKTDSVGNEEWTQSFGGNGWDAGYFVQPTDDGGYILTGDQNGSGYLLKTGSDGVLEWNYTYDFLAGTCVRQTEDGGYIAVGWDDFDIYILKTDFDGLEQWHKTIGNSSHDYAYAILEKEAGEYIISGTTDIPVWGECAYLICLGTESGVRPIDQPQAVGYSLLPAYPNPFNPSLVLRYRLQAASEVSIIVYDISGSEVVNLVNGWRGAGTHEVMFDGSNLSAGIYFAHLNAGEFNQIQKLVLLK